MVFKRADFNAKDFLVLKVGDIYSLDNDESRMPLWATRYSWPKYIPDLSGHVDLKSARSYLVRRGSRPLVLKGPPVPGSCGYLILFVLIPGIPELILRATCWGVYPVPGPKMGGRATDRCSSYQPFNRPTDQRNPTEKYHVIRSKNCATGPIRFLASVKSFQWCHRTKSKIRPDDTI